MADINLGRIKPIYKGEHQNNILYKELDIVTKDGNSYIALKDGQGEITDTTLFGLLSLKGNSFNPTTKGLKVNIPEASTVSLGDSYLAIDEGKIYFKLETNWSDGFSISGSTLELDALKNKVDTLSTTLQTQINAIPKVDAYTKAETDNKYLPKTETARNSNLLGGMVAEERAVSNTIVKRNVAGYVYASFINTPADTRNYNHNITNVWIEDNNDHWHRKISTNDFITLLKNRNLNASYAYKNATNTAQGGVKVRLSGTTLYITSNGANA